MYGQQKLFDGIRSFSPDREGWKDRPANELPDRVTVRFETGPSGLLDMKCPRALAWSNLLDLQRRYDKPVYVEIDPETRIITQLLIPETSRVMSITEKENGDMDVLFYRSQARHYLRHGNPDFQAMLEALQQASEDKTQVLVTATRDDYEIIDVRPPPKAPGAETPSPSSPPPTDPPVSPQRARELFDMTSATSCDACNASCSATPHCIPFKHAYDGCYARAHEMCRLMMAEGEDPEKVWIYGGLHVQTSNVHGCDISWGWHVAPTLMVTIPNGPDEKYVIDPSLCAEPVTVADWKALQEDPGATLRYSSWIPLWSDWHEHEEDEWGAEGISDPTFSQTNYYLELKCNYLQADCVTYGPPPYVCPIVRSCHLIVDRSTYSESEIDAMLTLGSPTRIEAAFYVVLDGYTPSELGITAASLSGIPNVVPTLDDIPDVAQMTVEAFALDVEDPSHLLRRQRITWTCNVEFTGTNGFGFSGDVQAVTLSASISAETCNATIHLIKQPNPYETDGETSWLSTDLRVFQIDQGQWKFGVQMDSDPSAFITQIIDNLNTGNTGGETFENDISVNQQTSWLVLSESVNNTPVYNFAVAKVRYRSLVAPADDVRVFFRLIPWATTSVEYDQTTEYRRFESGGNIISLPGILNNQLTSIPCFASPRVDSAVTSLTAQTDTPNVQTIPPDPGGNEVARYFGCWLDINQTTPQFPIQPSPLDGPYSSGRVNIQDHVRNEHQCLVSEIAFSPAPIPDGARPSTSDKLAQRNLAIVESANPGVVASRRIPQTFEIHPTSSRTGIDELMIDWGETPVGSVATLFMPGVDTNEILSLATKQYHNHGLVRIDEHTLKFETGGMSYVPIPATGDLLPGMLTVDLPEGVIKGQVFKIVVRQVTGGKTPITLRHSTETSEHRWRHIVGSFQLTIPVNDKVEILPAQQRLLSNLRWIERAIPSDDRWSAVFGRYVLQTAQRVDALGGDSNKVGPSPSGQWHEAYRNCRMLAFASLLLVMLLITGIGALAGSIAAIVGAGLFGLLAATVSIWKKRCRATLCEILPALTAGSGVGVILLALLGLAGITTPQLVPALIAGTGVTVIGAVASWLKGCFR